MSKLGGGGGGVIGNLDKSKRIAAFFRDVFPPCARLANICYLVASELITCVDYMPHGIQFSFCFQGGGWIRRIWGPGHCFNPIGIGIQTDTDTTQITIGSENLLSFSIFRDGSAEYFVMLLQEDPIAKVRKMFCESFSFFFLSGSSFQKTSLSI